MAKQALNPNAFALAAAIIAAACMLLLTIFGRMGIYSGAMLMMQEWHAWYTPTAMGTLTGMIEAALISYIFAYAFVWTYNKLAK